MQTHSRATGLSVPFGQVQLFFDHIYGAEVVEKVAVCAMPASDPHLLGMCNYRQKVLPVFTLFPGTKAKRYLRLGVEEYGFLLAIDQQVGSKHAFAIEDANKWNGLLEARFHPYVRRAFQGDEPLLDLDLKQFFLDLAL